jgi:hypothetical protein
MSDISKRRHTKNALNDKVKNVEGGEKFGKTVKSGRKPKKIPPGEMEIVIPFNIASRLNKEESIRGHQINLRKRLCVFIDEHFDDFVKDYQYLGQCTDPSMAALRMRLFTEVIKIVLPRPKELDSDEAREQNKSIINKLLGKE